MRILVLGAGSIGARHARNLLDIGVDVDVADPVQERAQAISGAGDHWPVEGPADVEGRDALLVATPTRLHAEHASWGVHAGIPVLVEKPVATSVDGARSLAASAAERQVMVAYNLRYHEPVQRLVAIAGEACGEVLGCRAWFGSYLPGWRPHVDYRESYSARRDLGGGVLLDAIHELDELVWLFDDLHVVGAVVRSSGTLEVDVEDTVAALLQTEDGVPVQVDLDYLSRRYRRGIEVIGSRANARLDWARRTIEIEDAEGVEVLDQDELVWDLDRAYVAQAEAFVRWVEGDVPSMAVDLREGIRSLELAEAIREAAGWT